MEQEKRKKKEKENRNAPAKCYRKIPKFRKYLLELKFKAKKKSTLIKMSNVCE